MTQFHEEKLKRISEDQNMLQAFGALFDEMLEEAKPRVLDTDDDYLIGQKYRAYDRTKDILTEIMKKIISYKEERLTNKTPNTGR